MSLGVRSLFSAVLGRHSCTKSIGLSWVRQQKKKQKRSSEGMVINDCVCVCVWQIPMDWPTKQGHTPIPAPKYIIWSFSLVNPTQTLSTIVIKQPQAKSQRLQGKDDWSQHRSHRACRYGDKATRPTCFVHNHNLAGMETLIVLFDWDSQFPIEQGISRRTEDVFCDIVWILPVWGGWNSVLNFHEQL